MNTNPFSDTSSPSPPRQTMLDQAFELIRRLPDIDADVHRFEGVMFSGMLRMLDRLEALEFRCAAAELQLRRLDPPGTRADG